MTSAYLDIARRILREEGYHSLTIERLAREAGFSKVTVYQRFSCKEELLVELGVRCRAELLQVIERAAQIPGPPRLRAEYIKEAIYLYSHRYAENLRILSVIRSDPILSKAPEHLRRQMEELGVRIFNHLLSCGEDGVANGDLSLSGATTPKGLAYMMWVIITGWAQTQYHAAAPLEAVNIKDPLKTINAMLTDLFDGYGWRPLSSEFDSAEIADRVHRALIEDPSLRFSEDLGHTAP